MIDQTNKHPSRNRELLGLFTAALIGTASLLLLTLPVSGLLLLIRERDRSPYLLAAAFLLILVSGYITGRSGAAFSGLRGWLCGLLSALILLLILLLIGLFQEYAGARSGWTLLMSAALLFSGMIGGVTEAMRR